MSDEFVSLMNLLPTRRKKITLVEAMLMLERGEIKVPQDEFGKLVNPNGDADFEIGGPDGR